MNERYEYGTFLRPHWLAGTRRGHYQMRAIVPNSGQLRSSTFGQLGNSGFWTNLWEGVARALLAPG